MHLWLKAARPEDRTGDGPQAEGPALASKHSSRMVAAHFALGSSAAYISEVPSLPLLHKPPL